MTIDGEAKELSWDSTMVASDFVQYKPSPGTPSTQKTEVRFMYDDDAIYVFALCHDKPEHVSKVLSQRDDFNANVDNFQLFLDTYNDDQNGFDFGVSSMGVQYDSKLFATGENVDLNMAWQSQVVRNEKGWQVEIRIPYSAFRFPKGEVQNWGIFATSAETEKNQHGALLNQISIIGWLKTETSPTFKELNRLYV
jgi:hypothetical protein